MEPEEVQQNLCKFYNADTLKPAALDLKKRTSDFAFVKIRSSEFSQIG